MHFLMRRRHKVATETALNVLAYNETCNSDPGLRSAAEGDADVSDICDGAGGFRTFICTPDRVKPMPGVLDLSLIGGFHTAWANGRHCLELVIFRPLEACGWFRQYIWNHR